MYYAIVTLFMFLLPLLSLGAEVLLRDAAFSGALVAQWFAFWAVGLRLLLAGLKQIAQPRYTAFTILGLTSDESLILVRELGFANVSIGLLGVLSLFFPAWQPAAALVGGLFYGLAGLNHVRQAHRNRLENVAMASDLWASVVLLGALLAPST